MIDLMAAPPYVVAFHFFGKLTGEDYDRCIAEHAQHGLAQAGEQRGCCTPSAGGPGPGPVLPLKAMPMSGLLALARRGGIVRPLTTLAPLPR